MLHTNERDAITVLLDSRSDDRIVRPFYCSKCGKCVCEIIGNVKILIPGVPDPIDYTNTGSKVVILCRGFLYLANGEKWKCDAKYIF